jgi:hypothetical protein
MLAKMALRIAVKKRAPERIPLSGEAAKKNDCYSVYVVTPDEKWGVLVESVQDEGVVGKSYEGDSYDAPCGVRWLHLSGMRFTFQRYYKGFQFADESPALFVIKHLFLFYQYTVLREAIAQFLFNRKGLVRHQRMQVLKTLVDQYLNSPTRGFRTEPFAYLNSIYGHRWIFHPQKDHLLRYYTLIFDSLESSNDLTKHAALSYEVSPSALVTLSSYEEDERKHQDSVSQQRKLVYLTIALVLVGVAQVSIEYWCGAP